LGGHLGWLHGLILLSGTMTKIRYTYQKIQLMEEADQLIHLGHWGKAHRKYEQLLAYDPQNIEFQLGFAETFNQDLAKGDKAQLEGLSLNLGVLKEKLENFEYRMDYFLQTEPKNPLLFNHYSEALAYKVKFGLFEVKENLDEVEERLKNNLEKEPKSVIDLGKYSLLLNQKEKKEEALAKVNEALAIDPNNSFILQIQTKINLSLLTENILDDKKDELSVVTNI
jgi:tetratricopeptide (TPR) repeat protein